MLVMSTPVCIARHPQSPDVDDAPPIEATYSESKVGTSSPLLLHEVLATAGSRLKPAKTCGMLTQTRVLPSLHHV